MSPERSLLRTAPAASEFGSELYFGGKERERGGRVNPDVWPGSLLHLLLNRRTAAMSVAGGNERRSHLIGRDGMGSRLLVVHGGDAWTARCQLRDIGSSTPRSITRTLPIGRSCSDPQSLCQANWTNESDSRPWWDRGRPE